MVPHRLRVILICTLAVVALVLTGIAFVTGAPMERLEALIGLDVLLVPAAIDSIAVERRRRKTGVRAISDDVE